MDDTDIATITRCFGNFKVIDAQKLDKPIEPKSNRGRQSENPVTEAPKTFGSKIFGYYEFGYRRITIERPLRESFQFSNERIDELRFAPKPLNAVMKWIYAEYGQEWSDDNDFELYGILSEHEDCIRKTIKSNFSKLKEKQIKMLLNDKLWLTQKQIMLKAKDLQQAIGTDQFDDMNLYNDMIKATGVQIGAKEKKQTTAAVSWKNPAAEKVHKKSA